MVVRRHSIHLKLQRLPHQPPLLHLASNIPQTYTLKLRFGLQAGGHIPAAQLIILILHGLELIPLDDRTLAGGNLAVLARGLALGIEADELERAGVEGFAVFCRYSRIQPFSTSTVSEKAILRFAGDKRQCAASASGDIHTIQSQSLN